MDDLFNNLHLRTAFDLYRDYPERRDFDALVRKLMLAVDKLLVDPRFRLNKVLPLDVFLIVRRCTDTFQKLPEKVKPYNQDIVHIPSGSLGIYQDINLCYGILDDKNLESMRVEIKINQRNNTISRINFQTTTERIIFQLEENGIEAQNSKVILAQFEVDNKLYYIYLDTLAYR